MPVLVTSDYGQWLDEGQKRPSQTKEDTIAMRRPITPKTAAVQSNRGVVRLPLYAMAVGAVVAALYISAAPGLSR
jgi:hypothetical protein